MNCLLLNFTKCCFFEHYDDAQLCILYELFLACLPVRVDESSKTTISRGISLTWDSKENTNVHKYNFFPEICFTLDD